MAGRNVLFIMSDEHSRRVLGAYGNAHRQDAEPRRAGGRGHAVRERLCNCPICVPSRASFATGRYVHEIGYWDNAFPYTRQPAVLRPPAARARPSLRLHRQAALPRQRDPNGFDNEILPLHVLDGKGDVQGMLRQHPPKRDQHGQLAGDAGAGESTYLAYDREIRDAAIDWLGDAARKKPDKPWCLFVSFVCPHFPLVAPPEFFDLYPLEQLPLPRLRDAAGVPRPSGAAQAARGPGLRGPFPGRGPHPHRDRRLLRHGLLPRRQYRPRAAGARGDRARRGHAGRLHLRPRRQSRHPHLLGQVEHVRGGGRRAADPAGAGHAARPPGATPVSLVDGYPTILEAVGVPPARRARLARRLAARPRARATTPTARCSANITRSARSPASSWSASAATSTSTTRATGRSSTTSRPTRWRRATSRAGAQATLAEG